MKSRPIKRSTILFDEFHSESWSISFEKARQMQPNNPGNSSYRKASELLEKRDFVLRRNLDSPLNADLMHDVDVLVMIHPCDPKWEATTCKNSPCLDVSEIANIEHFVKSGGGLLVITEYENDKYGNNLNAVLEPFGLQPLNSTVADKDHCRAPEAPHHVFATHNSASYQADILLAKVNSVCFYRAGSLKANNPNDIVLTSSSTATPPLAPLVAFTYHGKGAVAVVMDSDLFGDDYISDFSHSTLWVNLLHRLSLPSYSKARYKPKASGVAQSSSWLAVKNMVNDLRLLQSTDGSIDSSKHSPASSIIGSLLPSISSLSQLIPHHSLYLDTLREDITDWCKDGYSVPDFARSLNSFNPQSHREDEIDHVAIFPLYTPNGSREVKFEALVFSAPWPEWLAELERTRFQNKAFVAGKLLDFSLGYDGECAVLFPETVSLKSAGSNNFGVIFCDREAKRYQQVVGRACRELSVNITPAAACQLASIEIITDTFMLWDLIHDRMHGLGNLPFDPFMIRQWSPYWMDAIEELRVDLTAFNAAHELALDDFPYAENVEYAVLFDRIFRFPITGPRVKNYDALAGQLLFAYLHENRVLSSRDNRVNIDWQKLPDAILSLRKEIDDLYHRATNMPRLAYWLTAYDFISRYLGTATRSKLASWKYDTLFGISEQDPERIADNILDDEFPLGMFHSNLRKKLLMA